MDDEWRNYIRLRVIILCLILGLSLIVGYLIGLNMNVFSGQVFLLIPGMLLFIDVLITNIIISKYPEYVIELNPLHQYLIKKGYTIKKSSIILFPIKLILLYFLVYIISLIERNISPIIGGVIFTYIAVYIHNIVELLLLRSYLKDTDFEDVFSDRCKTS